MHVKNNRIETASNQEVRLSETKVNYPKLMFSSFLPFEGVQLFKDCKFLELPDCLGLGVTGNIEVFANPGVTQHLIVLLEFLQFNSMTLALISKIPSQDSQLAATELV